MILFLLDQVMMKMWRFGICFCVFLSARWGGGGFFFALGLEWGRTGGWGEALMFFFFFLFFLIILFVLNV